MEMENHLSRKRSSLHTISSPSAAVLSKMGGESLTDIDSLPDELVFAILVFVPAQDIQYGAKLVCKKWYHIINSPNFIYAHLRNSPPGLLIQYGRETKHSLFVTMQQGQIKKSKLNYKLNSFCRASCNGLVVDTNSTGDEPSFSVVNPTTGQRYALPPIPVKGAHYSHAVMAYVAASKEYKVLLMYSYARDERTGVRCCAILTVGVDRDWRHSNTNHLSLTTSELFITSPLIAGGFIYWTKTKGTHVLTLNVETEVFTSIPVPRGSEKLWHYFLSTGSSLTLAVTCNHFLWEVWELKQESGEWKKMFEIDMKPQKRRIKELVKKCCKVKICCKSLTHSWLFLQPVSWLDCGQVLVFRAFIPSRLCFLYNVRTQEIDSLELNRSCNLPRPGLGFHRNSLVHLVV